MNLTDVEINLHSGGTFRPFAPRVADIHITDIAHALANKCRWSGHTREFYSVAQHAVLVSRYTVAPAHRLWGLLHDAGEAYLPDVPSPIKAHLPLLVDAEELILAAVAVRFELPAEIPDMVHHADKLLLTTEARDLMAIESLSHPRYAQYPGPIRGERLSGWSPDVAESLFLKEFDKLTQGAR
jgi:hypothetical protein